MRKYSWEKMGYCLHGNKSILPVTQVQSHLGKK